MAQGAGTLRVPLALAGVWCVTATLSVLAGPLILATVPYWHEVRLYLAQIGLLQAWISIAACVGLLTLSRKKHSENEEGWAQGALLIYVLGGVVTAVLLNYGVLPTWLTKPAALVLTVQVLVLALLHWCFACLTLRSLLKFRKQL